MESSTPLAVPSGSNNLHRRTILKNALDASPLRRRSVLQTPVSLFEKVNDESERSNRRSLVDMQKILSNVPQGASPLNDSNKFLGEQDMKDHFQICTKLFTENKITPKNAWKLHIIDLLKHMAQKPSGNMLQVAGTSLDISAKVYGVRVDDIHADGLKLASTMARVIDRHPPQEADDDNADSDGNPDKENPAAKKKKKKKRFLMGNKNTIAKDRKSLRAPLPKLESVFFSTRTNADASAIDNLFTNILKMDNSGYKFMLLSKEKAWAHQPDPVVKDVNDPNRKRYPLSITPISNIKLCAPFSEFQVDEWDPDEEEKQLAMEKSTLAQGLEEVVYDDQGIPIPELDGSIPDIFDNQHEGDDEPMDADDDVVSVHEEAVGHIRGEITRIVEFRPDVTNGLPRSEYSYNAVINTYSGKVIDQIWAGPSHWKLKFIRRSSARFSGQENSKIKQIKQSRKRLQPQMIDYDKEYVEFDATKKLKIKKKPPTVDIRKITLPVPDTSCIKLMEHVHELMLKPGVRPVKINPNAGNEVDYEVSAYKYENPNDSQYCTQQNDDDDPDDADAAPFDDVQGDDNDAEEYIAAQRQDFLGDNLVDAPEAVPKSYVPYALQAKKMDMKKLKAAVWQNLINPKNILPKPGQETGTVVPTTFSKMFKELPDLLNEKMKKELSCSLAFVALLHLCNEQNLELMQHLCFKDFDIEGPPLDDKDSEDMEDVIEA